MGQIKWQMSCKVKIRRFLTALATSSRHEKVASGISNGEIWVLFACRCNQPFGQLATKITLNNN